METSTPQQLMRSGKQLHKKRIDVSMKQWDDERFLKQLDFVKSLWPTGKDVDLEEALAYLKNLPDERIAYKKYLKAEKEGRTLVMPFTGRTLAEDQEEAFRMLNDVADCIFFVWPSTDAFGWFETTAKALEESQRTGRGLLNGYPVSTYPLSTTRRVFNVFQHPINGLDSNFGYMHSVALAVAAGATQMNASCFTECHCYEDCMAIEECIQHQQFSGRYAGWFTERGVPIVVTHAGQTAGGPVPPSISSVVAIVDSLLSAGQGAKYTGGFYGMMDCVDQDVAGIRVCKKMTEYYLKKLGFKDVKVFQALTAWPGAYPRDKAKATALVCTEAMIAGYAKVVSHYRPKQSDEAFGIPTKEATRDCAKMVRFILDVMQNQPFPESKEFKLEEKMIEMEIRAIIDKMLEVGDGDIAKGLVKAFELGTFEMPFSTSLYNAGKMLVARDRSLAARFVDTGNLPFNQDIKDYHREKIADRKRAEHIKSDWDMIANDLRAGILAGH